MKFKIKKSTVKEFSNFSSLSLYDLKKIEKYHQLNIAAKKSEEKLISEIELKNNTIRKTIEFQKEKRGEYKRKYIDPIFKYLQESKIFLNHHQVSSFSYKTIFGDAIVWRGKRYQNIDSVREVIAEVEKQEITLKRNIDGIPYKDYHKIKEITYDPTKLDKKLFKFGGVPYYVYFKSIDIDLVKRCIDNINAKETERKRILDELKAKGAINNFETRKIADSFKRKYPLIKQLSTLKDCPYCNNALDSSNAHLEHIYPVSKGGKSIQKNLVWVCSTCNLKKKDLTLNGFIKKYDLDRESIESNLDFLGLEY